MTDLERYNRDKATVISMIKFILMFAIIIGLLYVGVKLFVILIPFLIGFLLAKTSRAIAEKFCKKVSKDENGRRKVRRITTVIYCILLVLIVIIIVLAFIALFNQANKAIGKLGEAAKNFNASDFANGIISKFSVDNGGFITPGMEQSIHTIITDTGNTVISTLPDILSGVMNSILGMIGSIPYGIFVVICIILSGYYFINDAPRVMKFYSKNVPNRQFRVKSINLLNTLSSTLFNALGGYLALLIITAVEAWVVFFIAGTDYAVILALVTAVVDFLPVLGVSAVMLPVAVYSFLHGNYYAVVVLIIGLALMTVIRRFLEPAILSKSLKMHPLLMLVGMAFGVYVWGAIGFLLGPTMLIIIMDVMKVFEIDKKVLAFMSRVLQKFMQKPEEIAEETKTE